MHLTLTTVRAPQTRLANPFDTSPAAAYTLSVASVALTTWLLRLLQNAITATEAHGHIRPFGIAYVLPISALTILAGARAGVATLVLSILSLLLFLMPPHMEWLFVYQRDAVELIALVVVGILLIYGLESVRRNASLLAETADVRAKLENSEAMRQAFNREVLLAVTGGRLLLCDRDELRAMLSGEDIVKIVLQHVSDSGKLRHAIREELRKRDLEAKIRTDDLLTAVTEAASNAVKHGYRGVASLWLGSDHASVLISDHGSGIHPSDLARATLQRGYSTRSTLGMGFTMMLNSVDMLGLATSPEGTDLLLRVGSHPLATPEEEILARYSGEL